MLIKYLMDMDWSGLKWLNDCDSARMNNMGCQQDNFFSAEFMNLHFKQTKTAFDINHGQGIASRHYFWRWINTVVM